MSAGTVIARDAACAGCRGLLITAALFPDSGWERTHEAFLAADPRNRAVVASPCGEIRAMCRVMCPECRQMDAAAADARRIFASAEVRSMTHPDGEDGPGLPLAVIVRPTAHWWAPGTAAQLAADYTARLAPGSRFAMFVPVPGDGPDGREWLDLMTEAAGAPAHAHHPDGITGWLTAAGLDAVTVRDARELTRPGWLRTPPGTRQPHVLAATGLVP